MWDYDKFFAEGNIIGISPTKNEVINLVCSKFNHNIDEFRNLYSNNDLSYKNIKIQYIIRLDEHGNVIEKLFDREKNTPKPMPKLKTGMFIRVIDNQSMEKTTLGYVDTINNNIVYQDGTYNEINYLRKLKGIVDIVEIYSEKSLCFDLCDKNNIIWRAPEYQKYLNSQDK